MRMLYWIGQAERERKAQEAERQFAEVFKTVDPRAWQVSRPEPRKPFAERIGFWIGSHVRAVIGPALTYIL